MTNTNPYINSTRAADKNRLHQWEIGRRDRIDGFPCKSTNGAYLEGWYSIPHTPNGTRYYSLNSGKTTYTCLSIEEAEDMQSRLGGSISHQFTNE